jgi:hypothetical protein
VKKKLTREQAEAAKEKAARFVDDVLEDEEHADEIRSEDLDEWAARKRVTIIPNPKRRQQSMATPRELKERIEELEAENEELQERLDSIAEIISPDEEEEDDDEEDEESSD